jgi:hypothetical protein
VYALLVTLCIGAAWANGQATIYVSQDGTCGGHTPCYSTIQGGIDSVSAPSILKITQETYDEDVVLDVNQIITLEGGWDTSFTSCSSHTIITGSLTIPDGTLILGVTGRIILLPPPPKINSFSANPGTINSGQSSTLTWTITSATSASIDQGVGTVNPTSGSTSVSPVTTTTYTLTATNPSGFVTAQVTVTVNNATIPPVIVSFTANPETINPGESSTLSWNITNATSASIDMGVGSVNHGAGSTSVSPVSNTTYTLTASNGIGSSTAQVTVIVSGTLPPDPSTVAPPVDRMVSTDMKTATSFLYRGNPPIQTGVAPGAIDSKRTAVLRGKVLDKNNDPLPGVTVTVLDHPEYGQTLSRSDGMFDLAVNGGGYLTINYQKSGYLSAQRQIDAPWQDYVWAPDVVLIALDSQATAIDLNAGIPFQAAQGSVSSDSRGTRQSTLLFAQGTQAELVYPDGTTQPVSNLTVRSTEYTVGENGPNAMPGDLPLGIGYTYAVELTVDEALAAGASTIRFSQPVVNYLENFLGFRVGVVVPAYYYDRKQGIWIPFPSGRVIKILGSTGGLADLDVDGDDMADTGAKLTDLGISDAERQQLVGLYPTGQSLWRVALLHFSPCDLNYPRYLPDPYQNSDKIKSERNEDDSCKSGGGSVIECQNQKLGESIAVTGTSFTLNYQSGGIPGRLTSDTMVIPLTGPDLRCILDADGCLHGVELRIQVAGRQFSYNYPPTPNLSHAFTWDGMDAYGRKLQGAQPIRVSMGYKYLGRRCSGPRDCDWQPGTEDIYWRDWWETIGHWDSGKALGGWTLSVHHSYDPVAQTLYLGTGEQRSAVNQALVVDTVAGNGQFCNDYAQPCGDGGKATDAQLYPWGVDVGPDGSLYITDEDAWRIWRAWPDGTITVVAGNKNNQWCDVATDPCGDGGPATQASFGDIYQSVVGLDGSIYIADEQINRIRKVSPDGIITTVAGTGERGFAGDGGPATQAKLNEPYGVRVTPDGNLYIADTSNHRIRRVGPDGIITTVAGNGTDCAPWNQPCSVGDGGPAPRLLWVPLLMLRWEVTVHFTSLRGVALEKYRLTGLSPRWQVQAYAALAETGGWQSMPQCGPDLAL